MLNLPEIFHYINEFGGGILISMQKRLASQFKYDRYKTSQCIKNKIKNPRIEKISVAICIKSISTAEYIFQDACTKENISEIKEYVILD